VNAGLLVGQPALIHELLDVGVVLGDLPRLAAAHQIGPAVADVPDEPPPLDRQEQRRRGRPHARAFRLALPLDEDDLISVRDRVAETLTGDPHG
jgi:hypothetical protein